MDRLSLRGKLISKAEVLAYPSKFEKSHIMIFELADEKHYEAAKTFYKEWKGHMKYLILSLGFQDDKFEVRAKNLFFSMRDKLAAAMGDTSHAHKTLYTRDLWNVQISERWMVGQYVTSPTAPNTSYGNYSN